jgi:hypothetical protein
MELGQAWLGGIADTIGEAYNVTRGNIPNVSYKVPSYITERLQAPSAIVRTGVISVV